MPWTTAVTLHQEGVSSRVQIVKLMKDWPGHYRKAPLFSGGAKAAVVPLQWSTCQTAATTPVIHLCAGVQTSEDIRHGTLDCPHHAAWAQQSTPRTSRAGKAALWGGALLCSDFSTQHPDRDKILSDNYQVTFVWGYRTFLASHPLQENTCTFGFYSLLHTVP